MKREENNRLTFNSGKPVTDNQNVMTAGERGPVLMENIWLQEKLATFNRERIPERVVHAKGSGAFGYFTVTQDITKYTSASLFSSIGKQTPVFVRFSTVAGEKGAADTERDVRGFAIKFYTDSGNWDLVGNNTPVFFIRDPLKFPDFIHTQKRDPKTNMRSNTAMWDFWSLSPESMHQVLILMSDRGIPASYRHMHGYGSHTYSFFNWQNHRVWVKFHFITQQGIKNLTNEEASQIIALDREASQRDLYRNIKSGNYPSWKMCVQIMTEQEAVMYKVNPFDLTKVWSHKDFPLIEVGVLELSINPDNYFAQVEQAAFNPANIISGIGFSPDRMLQGRLFAYGDAQRYRLGVNHDKIIVNSPHTRVQNYHRDGLMRTDENGGSDVNYEPNSFNGPKTDSDFCESKIEIIASAMHYDHRRDGDYYSQPRALYELMEEDERDRVVLNIVETLLDVPDFIQLRSAARLYLINKQLGLRVAALIHLNDEQIGRKAKELLNKDLIQAQQ